MLTEHFGLLAPSISQVDLSRWMSPELVNPDTEEEPRPTTASDVWALACTLFEVSHYFHIEFYETIDGLMTNERSLAENCRTTSTSVN
jgi:serine/threonine protein kinase